MRQDAYGDAGWACHGRVVDTAEELPAEDAACTVHEPERGGVRLQRVREGVDGAKAAGEVLDPAVQLQEGAQVVRGSAEQRLKELEDDGERR